ncbi:MAG: DNA-directed RNA polymerase subunit beta' [Lentisphaerae bacterium]|nr:DNA-directed RNA polymerase subunit beta' [Lentisphaerota bacterium]MBT4822977.1 DNA-directed RNA polymerase subunit beta' [Lentisphaerota bacterium]MBT5609429.1 DNA-directed RNA polymerase subunit beta' [Lentisphaerota bacterium]MBT7061250.1 DNA-directed RNA polymerase subunit beta' [Lentisphaerota bacterium]MBT7848709.1 DNA-directed RNA polymerase subunit beta' [Lentisphaerota bacterium]
MDNSTLKQVLGIDEADDANCVTIGIASPEVIRSWSRGEVKNPETINYRSFKPEKGGLFCERIFGPTRDWECNCGKYKRIKHKGIVCDRCGVEVTQSRVRRERMGHIELAVPVSHVWFFKCMPSRIGLMLDMTARSLERVTYYEDWIVTDPGDTPLEYKMLLSDEQYREAREMYGDAFEANMGAEAIQMLLAHTDLPKLAVELTEAMQATKSKANRKKIAKRMRLVEGFHGDKMDPGWMVLTVLPVIPPDLRPLVPLEGGRFATSDLNDLYRRVINRNNRLKNLLQLRTPEVIIRNEKRMLQEAVDALMDNGRHGRPVTGTGNRPLKSLSDMLKGKQGRFRQNLLGKRVDYSGRSVIVVGPELRLHQCGLPKAMALVLFEPFIMRRLKERGYVHTVRSAKKMIERRAPVVWDVLDEVIKGHPIMLNRAPTLHRLSIQAFDPILIEGQAIQLHPLVCKAYNADFDGDQMAVHIPLSNEAQLETKLLMLAPNNIFSPANGAPVTVPTQDITLGSYYLTYESAQRRELRKKGEERPRKAFSDYFEVLRALDADAIHIHEFFRYRNPDHGTSTVWGNSRNRFIETTAGRCIFNEIWPDDMGFHNDVVGQKKLGKLVKECYGAVGRERLIQALDDLKDLGYEYATRAGFSIGITDMIIPEGKAKRVGEAQELVNEVSHQREQGVITELERYNKCVDIWTQANNDLAGVLFETLEQNAGQEEINPVFAMLDSGARGSKDQIRQLAGMRGLMAKPSGEIIERPILANFREGLSVLEYFISSHGARKGLADTALKTADSGYMTRKLVDVAHDVICVEEDCGTVNGIWVRAIREGDEDMVPLVDRIVGRYSVDDIHDPLATDAEESLIVGAGEEVTPEVALRIVDVGVERVHIRSVLTCESEEGICSTCYGRNLATGELPHEGDALGIIAAQSIGEPGTQLTMRTFHYGGTASASFRQPVIKARVGGILRLEEVRCVEQKDGSFVVLNRNGFAVLEKEEDGELIEVERHELIPGAVISTPEGGTVSIDEIFVRWDPYHIPIITKTSGHLEYRDLIEGVTMKREVTGSGTEEVTVLEHREDLHPQLVICDAAGEALDHYSLPAGAYIMVDEGQEVSASDTLARTPRQSVRTKDITGGLPRVAELFEARRPKEAAEIARIDGIVELGNIVRGKRTVMIRDPENDQVEEHTIPAGKRVVVFNGDFVRKGQPLTDGAVVPHEILEVCGPQDLQEYLVNEVQEVYRLQGVEINDKHIEIIVRQMMRKVRITEPGTTGFLFGESVDRRQFLDENMRVLAEGGQPAEAQPILLGITKASLETESFISAASFQDTTRVLTEAATLGRVDFLRGFKENVIMGQLIPAGTGYRKLTNVVLEKAAPPEPSVEEANAALEAEELAGAKTGKSAADKTAEARRLLDL